MSTELVSMSIELVSMSTELVSMSTELVSMSIERYTSSIERYTIKIYQEYLHENQSVTYSRFRTRWKLHHGLSIFSYSKKGFFWNGIVLKPYLVITIFFVLLPLLVSTVTKYTPPENFDKSIEALFFTPISSK